MTEVKDTNPKDAVGTSKVPFSTIPAAVLAETGLAMLEGALKYGRHNYRVAGVRASVYYDAALRHLASFWEGEDIDPDSGLPHLVKAIACCIVIRDSQIQENWVDDRPPKTPGDWVQELNTKAKALLEKYPDPLPAHTALDQTKAEETFSFSIQGVDPTLVRLLMGDNFLLPPVDLDADGFEFAGTIADEDLPFLQHMSQPRQPRVWQSLTHVPLDVEVYGKDEGPDDWPWHGEGPDGSTEYDEHGPFTEIIKELA